MEKMVGKTKMTGFQFGIRRTFKKPMSPVWDFMFSPEGINIWLGHLKEPLEPNRSFHTREGIEGLVRIFKPLSHIRMTWQQPGWKNRSILQVRIYGDQNKVTISFHQEKILDSLQREEMKLHWTKVMSQIGEAIETIH